MSLWVDCFLYTKYRIVSRVWVLLLQPQVFFVVVVVFVVVLPPSYSGFHAILIFKFYLLPCFYGAYPLIASWKRICGKKFFLRPRMSKMEMSSFHFLDYLFG